MNLRTALRFPLQTNVSLSSYSTFKVGGPARYFSEPRTHQELKEVLEFRAEENLPLFIVGRGSNLIFSDRGFNGLVLSLRKMGPDKAVFEDDFKVRVPGGTGLYPLALFARDHELGGCEFLCHVPGTVGGAVVMNAGFGRPNGDWHEISEILEHITVMDLEGNVKISGRKDLGFAYRKSNLTSHEIVLDAVLKLEPKPREEIQKEIDANFAYRNSVQDLRYPSAGSIFKNPKPYPLSSGQLLERAGMKKMRIGGAMVSERHANFIVNIDHATASDILALMEEGKRRVLDKFGVFLEPEVRHVPSGYEEGEHGR